MAYNRHRIVLDIYTAGDDQSESEAVAQTIRDWMKRGMDSGEAETGVRWPMALSIEYKGESYVEELPTDGREALKLGDTMREIPIYNNVEELADAIISGDIAKTPPDPQMPPHPAEQDVVLVVPQKIGVVTTVYVEKMAVAIRVLDTFELALEQAYEQNKGEMLIPVRRDAQEPGTGHRRTILNYERSMKVVDIMETVIHKEIAPYTPPVRKPRGRSRYGIVGGSGRN